MVPLLDAMRQMRDAAGNGGSCQAMLKEFDQRWKAADIDYLEEEIPKAIDQSLEGIQRVTRIVRAMKEFFIPGRKKSRRLTSTRPSKLRSRWRAMSGGTWRRLRRYWNLACRPSRVTLRSSIRSSSIC